MSLVDSFLERLSSDHTRRAYQLDLQQFFEDKGVTEADVQSVTVDDVHRFVRSMHQKELAVSTQRRRLAAVRRFFDWLIERGTVSRNPARDPRVEPRSPASESSDFSLLTKAEVQRLVDVTGNSPNTGPRDQALILTIVYAALRRSEVATMNVEDVRPLGRQWVIDLHTESSAQGGYVQIPDVLVEAIERMKETYNLSSGRLWRSLSNRNAGEPMSPDAIYKVVRRMGERASLGAVTVETLRQTGLRLAMDAGATLQQVQMHGRLKSAVSVQRLNDTENRSNRLSERAVDFFKLDI